MARRAIVRFAVYLCAVISVSSAHPAAVLVLKFGILIA
jgi:hypothetical protein